MYVFLISERILTSDFSLIDEMPPLKAESDLSNAGPRLLQVEAASELGQLARGLENTQAAAIRAAGLRWWLARAWSHWRAAESGRYMSVHPAVDRAARIWREDPERSLQDVASRVGVSPGRLGRLFKRDMGQGVVGFRTEQKLARVETIVRDNPRLGLLTAALDAGFGSYAQFYRAYKALRGRSPRVLRQNQ